MANDVVPMMSYRNGVEALDWLVAAFGFTEHVRMENDEGRLEHAELGAGSGTIMLATPSLDYEGPALHRSHCESSSRWQEVPYLVDGLLVRVDDVDEHFKRPESTGPGFSPRSSRPNMGRGTAPRIRMGIDGCLSKRDQSPN